MTFRHRLFATGLAALGAGRIDRWLPGGADAAGFILTLHRVHPGRAKDFDPNAHLSISPTFLDRLITQLKAEGWRFVPLGDLIDPRNSQDAGHRRAAVTIDDAFTDILHHALPVFRRRNVPFTLYVVPGFCNRSVPIWWEALERIVAAGSAMALPGDGLPPPLPCRTAREKTAAFRAWAGWFAQAAEDGRQHEMLAALARPIGIDLLQVTAELTMGWDDIRTFAAEPLCTLGAHTVTHPALSRLPDEQAAWEMSESAGRIEAETGVRPETIAFPYGTRAAAGRREGRIARQCGFAASLTTRPGFVPRGGGHMLPRISVNGCLQRPGYFRPLLTPGLWELRTRREAPAA